MFETLCQLQTNVDFIW